MTKKRIDENGIVHFDINAIADPAGTAVVVLVDVLRMLSWGEDIAPHATAQERLCAVANVMLRHGPVCEFSAFLLERLKQPVNVAMAKKNGFEIINGGKVD